MKTISSTLIDSKSSKLMTEINWILPNKNQIEEKTLLAGSYDFQFDEIEVYQREYCLNRLKSLGSS